MLTIHQVSNHNQLLYEMSADNAVAFLHKHLDKFGDTKSAIRKAIDYALSDESGKGGFLLIAREDSEPVGMVVMNRTGMSEYIPEYVLVYIAVRQDKRGAGIGSNLIREVMRKTGKPIALHVEYDNPARKLYERLGFSSKYAEMRFNPGE